MLQFHHLRQETHGIEATVALEGFDKTIMETLFTEHADQLMLPIGVTIKSGKDQYSKQVGREQSSKNLVLVICNLKTIEQREAKHVFRFKAKVEHNRRKYTLDFELTTVKESTKVKFVNAYLVKE